MSIGRFSSLSRISVRMLRHYDIHGVLVPADVDEFTGYRRYAATQLADAAAIRRLRDVGFGVSAIGAVLATRGTPAYYAALHAQRAELAVAADEALARLRLIDHLLSEKEPTMTDTVTEEIIPARTVVYLRGTIDNYAAEGQLWERLFPRFSSKASLLSARAAPSSTTTSTARPTSTSPCSWQWPTAPRPRRRSGC